MEQLATRDVRGGVFNREQSAFFWDDVAKLLRETKEFDYYYTEEFVLEEIQSQRIQLWGFGKVDEEKPRLFLLTRVQVFPKAKCLQVFWCGGEGIDDYLETINFFMDGFASMMGATRIEVAGRLGWARKLKAPDVEMEAVVLSRPVRSHKNG